MRRLIVIAALLVSQCIMRPGIERVPAVIYHMEGSQEAYGIEETHDGRYYIISGWTSEGGYHPPRCMLLKVDREGNLVEKRVHESLEWYCDFIIKSENRREYFLGNGSNIVKLDESLNIVGKRRYETFVPHFITDQIESREYGAIYALSHLRDVRVYKIDETLEPIDSFYAGPLWSRSTVIEGSGDGGVYIAVQESDTAEGRQGYRVIRLSGGLDSIAGNFIDVGGLFGYSAGYVTGMERFGDGTYLISAIIVRGFLDGFSALFRVDSMGHLVAYRTIDYSMASVDGMTKLRSGDIALVGSALREGVFFTFVMRLRPDLSTVWDREYRVDNSVFYGSIIQDSDGNLVLAGYLPIHDDIAFMKLDPYTGEPLVWSRR